MRPWAMLVAAWGAAALGAIALVQVRAEAAESAGAAEAQFEQLFGERVRRAAATRDTKDDLALARELLTAAASLKDSPEVAGLACRKAADLASGAASPDVPLAVEALDALSRLRPDLRAENEARALKLLEQRHPRALPAEKRTLAPLLAARLAEAGDAKAAAGASGEVIALYRRALALPGLAAGQAEALRARLKLAGETLKVDQRIEQLRKQLAAKPDPAAAKELAVLTLVELDRPGEIAALVLAAQDAALQRVHELATKDPAELAERALLELGQFYAERAKAASPRGRASALRRATGHLERYLQAHAKEDASRLLATQALAEAKAELARLSAGAPGAGLRVDYDFATLANLEEFLPQSDKWAVAPGKGLVARDHAQGIYTRRAFAGDLRVTVVVSSDDGKEVGVALMPEVADNAKGKDCLWFLLHGGDDGSTSLVFQRPETAVKEKLLAPGKAQTITLTRRGHAYTWAIDGRVIWEGTDDRLGDKPVFVYLYSHFSTKTFERLSVEGREARRP